MGNVLFCAKYVLNDIPKWSDKTFAKLAKYPYLDNRIVYEIAFCSDKGKPQKIHFSAMSDILFPHSGHLIKATINHSFLSCLYEYTIMFIQM